MSTKTRVCIICQQPFQVAYNRVKPKETCSRSCQTRLGARSRNFKGENNPAYKGGLATYTNGQGKTYRYLIGSSKKVPEHRLVMEQVLGRSLNLGEEVHHINGDTLDNRPDNLYVLDKRKHSRLHFQLFMKIQKLEQENRRLKGKLISLSSKPLPFSP